MRARCSLLLAAALAFSTVASAATGDKRAAAQRFRSGSALYEQERFVEALEEFEAGYATFPLPGFQVNIGQCYRKLDRLDDAAAAFGKFLESGSGDRKLRDEVEDALAEVKLELARRAEAQARRRHDEDGARRELLASIAVTHPPAATEPVEPAAAADPLPPGSEVPPAAMAPLPELRAAPPTARARKSRWWVWTIVGVAATSAVVAAVTVGVIEGQPQTPRAGSLGLLDGRR